MSDRSYCYDHPRPAVTSDVALFRHGRTGWELLLVRRAEPPFKDSWALPGGFVDEWEDIDDAAHRELKEECGIDGVRLWQFRAFGNPRRDPRGRTISIGYLGVLDRAVEAKAGDDAGAVEWFPIDRLPQLAFDHDEVVRAALERLRSLEP